jgi:hypothetical protein
LESGPWKGSNFNVEKAKRELWVLGIQLRITEPLEMEKHFEALSGIVRKLREKRLTVNKVDLKPKVPQRGQFGF